MSKLIIEDKPDDITRYNHPFKDFENEKDVPYGHVCDDGIYRLCYDTCSRYGYSVNAIYGVCHYFNDGGYPDHMYHIFIGECPHKDENGDWTTYNEVPNFMIGAFAGANYISSQPDIPHIIHLETDESRYVEKSSASLYKKSADKQISELSNELRYCTFKTYWKGIKNRFHNTFGKCDKTVGERVIQYRYDLYRKAFHIVLECDKDGTNKHLWCETENWWRFIHFKLNGKYCLKYEKRENSHCYTAC